MDKNICLGDKRRRKIGIELQSSRTAYGTLTDIPTRELLKECKSAKLFLWSYRGMSEPLADEELFRLVAIALSPKNGQIAIKFKYRNEYKKLASIFTSDEKSC